MTTTVLLTNTEIAHLDKRIKRLAKKFGQENVAITIGDKVLVPVVYQSPVWWMDDVRTKEYRTEVHIDAFVLGPDTDYTFVATLEDGMIYTAPGMECPEEFRDVEPTRCDACGVKHIRNSQYVLRDATGKYIVVGGNCMNDLFGTDTVLLATAMESIYRMLAVDEGSEDFDGPRSRKPDTIDINTAAMVLQVVANRHGYVSGSTAYNSFDNLASTKDRMYDFLFIPDIAKSYTEQDRNVDPNFLDIVRKEVQSMNDGSNFEENLKTLLQNEDIPVKSLGFFSYLFKLYLDSKVVESNVEATYVPGRKEKVAGRLVIEQVKLMPDNGYGVSTLVTGMLYLNDDDIAAVSFFVSHSTKKAEGMLAALDIAKENGKDILIKGTCKDHRYDRATLTRVVFNGVA